MFLEMHFGEIELHMPEDNVNDQDGTTSDDDGPAFVVDLDEGEARISLLTMVRHRVGITRSPDT
jgi:cleavage and polyadenylation specificity factor subunit 3